MIIFQRKKEAKSLMFIVSQNWSRCCLDIYGFESIGEEKAVRVAVGSSFVLQPPPLNASAHLSLSWTWYFENNEVHSFDYLFLLVAISIYCRNSILLITVINYNWSALFLSHSLLFTVCVVISCCAVIKNDMIQAMEKSFFADIYQRYALCHFIRRFDCYWFECSFWCL